jgi:Ca2+-binding RTX toxin-like protein
VDIAYVTYMLIFGASFSFSLGVFGGSSDEDETTTTSTTTPASTPADPNAPSAFYRAADYDRIENGSEGDDTEVAAAGTTDDIAWFLGAGNDDLTGSAGIDYVEGGTGNDTVSADAGNDVLLGGEGNDSLDGEAGNDLILTEAGDDHSDGGAGNDLINGGTGNDTLLGGEATDALTGGDGDDYLSGNAYDVSTTTGSTTPDEGDTLSGGAGNDTVLIGPGDEATGGAGDDFFALDQRQGHFNLISTIDDFQTGDIVELVYTPAVDTSGTEIAPNIAIRPNTAGTGSILSVNGTDVAVIMGGQSLTLSDIRLRDV